MSSRRRWIRDREPSSLKNRHRMEVSVTDPHVTVVIDGVAYIDQDLSGAFAFPAYVGFTAGTGSVTNRHLIQDLTVTDRACD